MSISEKKHKSIKFERQTTRNSEDLYGVTIGTRQRDDDLDMFESPIFIQQLMKRHQESQNQPDQQIGKPIQNQMKVPQECHVEYKKIQIYQQPDGDDNGDQSSFGLSEEPLHRPRYSKKSKLKYKNSNQQIWDKLVEAFKPGEDLQQYFNSEKGPKKKIKALLKQPNFKQKLKQIIDNGDVLEKLKKSKAKQNYKIKNIKAYQKLKQQFLKFDPLRGSKLLTNV